MAGKRAKYRAPKDGGGKMVHVYLPAKSLKQSQLLENFSRFVQIALDEQIGVMQWATMKERAPHLYYDVIKRDTLEFEELLDNYNSAYPLDPLTLARKKKQEESEWLKNSQNKPELW